MGSPPSWPAENATTQQSPACPLRITLPAAGCRLPAACNALLAWAGLASGRAVDAAQLREQSLDLMAQACVPLHEALCSL